MGYDPETGAIDEPEDFYSSVRNEILAESYLSYNPGQKLHLGKILLKSMRRHPLDTVIQIDASNNDQESIGSVLDRSIDMAKALRSFGVNVGDVVAVMARSHLDVCIPFYASFFVGAALMGVDNDSKIGDLKSLLSIGKPKLLFCEVEHLEIVRQIKDEFQFEVVTFGKGENVLSFSEFIEKHKTDESNTEFRVSEHNPEKTTALIASTSGSTGLPKAADITHANLAPFLPLLWTSGQGEHRAHCRTVLSLAPPHWLPASLVLLQSAIFCVRRVQTSAPLSNSHVAEIIRKYKPSWTAMSPDAATNLLKSSEAIEWTAFETFGLWGSPVPEGLISNLNKLIGKKAAVNAYGLTETSGRVFRSPEDEAALGIPLPHVEVKLVDPENTNEVTAAGVGELWLKGPSIFRGYYNDKESTGAVFSDGWFRSGDLLRRDGGGQYFFVERLGTNFKYKDHHVSTEEIESLLRKLDGVKDAALVGIPQGAAGALPLACVVSATPRNLTVAHVMDYVKENLSDSKQLRGGVMFLESLPMTASGEVDRKELQRLAIEHYNSIEESGARTNGMEKIRFTNEEAPKKGIFCCC